MTQNFTSILDVVCKNASEELMRGPGEFWFWQCINKTSSYSPVIKGCDPLKRLLTAQQLKELPKSILITRQ
jgi:hypothetical protein